MKAVVGLAALVLVMQGGGVLAQPAAARSPLEAGAFPAGSIAYLLNGRVVVRAVSGATRTIGAATGVQSLAFLSNGHLIAARQSRAERGTPICDLYDLSASGGRLLVTHRRLARQVTGSWGGGCEIVGVRDRIGVMFLSGACAPSWVAVDPATLTAEGIRGDAGLSVASDGARAAWLVNRLVCGTPAFVPVAGSLRGGRARTLSLPIPVMKSHLGRVRAFPYYATGPVAISPSGMTVAFAERTRTDVKLWAGPVSSRLRVIARVPSVDGMHWSADGTALVVAELRSGRAMDRLLTISYPQGRREELGAVSSSDFAVAVAP